MRERIYTDEYLGTGGAKQKGIASYAFSANAQRPLAGTLNAAIFNSARRFAGQVLYVAPPFIFFYFVTQWTIERYASPLIDI